jgi:hypothetical protein
VLLFLLLEVRTVAGRALGDVGLFQRLGKSRNDAKTWRADTVPQLKSNGRRLNHTWVKIFIGLAENFFRNIS